MGRPGKEVAVRPSAQGCRQPGRRRHFQHSFTAGAPLCAPGFLPACPHHRHSGMLVAEQSSIDREAMSNEGAPSDTFPLDNFPGSWPAPGCVSVVPSKLPGKSGVDCRKTFVTFMTFFHKLLTL